MGALRRPSLLLLSLFFYFSSWFITVFSVLSLSVPLMFLLSPTVTFLNMSLFYLSPRFLSLPTFILPKSLLLFLLSPFILPLILT